MTPLSALFRTSLMGSPVSGSTLLLSGLAIKHEGKHFPESRLLCSKKKGRSKERPFDNWPDLLSEVVLQSQPISGGLVRIATNTACLCHRGERRQQIGEVEGRQLVNTESIGLPLAIS